MPSRSRRCSTQHAIDSVFHLAARDRSSAPCTPRRSRPSNRTSAAPGRCSRPAAQRGVERVVCRLFRQGLRGSATNSPTARTSRCSRPRPTRPRKAAADLIARSYWHAYGLPVAVTRFANIYGGGDLNFSRPDPGGCRARRSTAAPRCSAPTAQPRARLPLRRGRRRRLPGDRRRARPRRRSAARPSTPAASGPQRCARWSS